MLPRRGTRPAIAYHDNFVFMNNTSIRSYNTAPDDETMQGFVIFDVSTRSAPKVVGGPLVTQCATGNGRETLKVVGKTVFIAGEGAFGAVDVSDPTAPKMHGPVSESSVLSDGSEALAIAGDLAFTIDSGGWKKWDISNPSQLKAMGGRHSSTVVEWMGVGCSGLSVHATPEYVVFMGSKGLAVFKGNVDERVLCAKVDTTVTKGLTSNAGGAWSEEDYTVRSHLLGDAQFLFASGGAGTEVFECPALAR